MGAALALLACAGALAFAVWPLVRRTSTGEMDVMDTGELASQRDLAINDIRELDFDRDLGNLSEEDHLAMREQSKRRAVAVLRQLQAREGRIDAEIEEAVAGLRGRGTR